LGRKHLRRQPAEFVAVTAGGILLGGGPACLLARNADHVGTSGLVFSYFGFLASRTLFDPLANSLTELARDERVDLVKRNKSAVSFQRLQKAQTDTCAAWQRSLLQFASRPILSR
jgi:hypothetical protein